MQKSSRYSSMLLRGMALLLGHHTWSGRDLLSSSAASKLSETPCACAFGCTDAGQFPLVAWIHVLCGLQAAGVQVKSFHYNGTFHGFLHFPVPQAGQALDAMAAELRSAFAA